MLITVALVLLVASASACQQGLPYREPEEAATMGYAAGVTWGKKTPAGADIYWLTPDQAMPCHEERLIPRHYIQEADLAEGSASYRQEITQAYNWGFYRGFLKGAGVAEPPSSGAASCP